MKFIIKIIVRDHLNMRLKINKARNASPERWTLHSSPQKATEEILRSEMLKVVLQ